MQGSAFGNYRLLEIVGSGGMGEVWRAHDTITDRIVAIKVLSATLSQDAEFQRRYRPEALAAARLENPHVIPLHTYGDVDGRLFLDMRLIEGRNLHEVIVEQPMTAERTVNIVEQIADALQAAHAVGLVHRDVKPSNVLLAEKDFAYLIDFGIARVIGETGITSTGSMIGSWHYMAPERLSGADASIHSDVYSLACLLYECLTGARPFPGDSLESQVGGHMITAPPRPSAIRPTLPATFDAVIATGMAKDPAARYPSATALATAARAAITRSAMSSTLQSEQLPDHSSPTMAATSA
ncbi:MAG: serine/threonine-protein kinase, partial [Mycobacterium sp.]